MYSYDKNITTTSGNICLKRTPKNISFGRGLTHIVTNKDCYFDKYIADKNTVSSVFVANNKSLFSEYFMPFMRLSRIAAKSKPKELKGEAPNGCKFTVLLDKPHIDFLSKIYDSTCKSVSYLYWIPDRIVDGSDGLVRDNDMKLLKTFKNFSKTQDKMFALTQRMLKKAKKFDDLVIVVGSKESDFNAINPFNYVDSSPSLNNFENIRNTKLRSAFIVDDTTPENLRHRVKNLANICNADGNIRLAVIDKRYTNGTPAIIDTVMLLQKEYAKYSKNFRDKISTDLRVFLESRDIPYPIEREPSIVQWKPAKDWSSIVQPDTRTISQKIISNLMKNKLATLLLITSVGVPIYFRQTSYKKTN